MRWQVEKEALEGADGFPIILFANHETWWDGFFDVALFTRYGLDYAIMMDAANLDRHWFFKYTGCFGVDRASSKGRAAGLLAATRWLRVEGAKRRTLVLYPHGRLTEPFEPWPPFEPGLQALARTVPKARFVPVAKRIVHREKQKPEAFLKVGHSIPAEAAREDGFLEEALRSCHGALVEAIVKREVDGWEQFRVRWKGKLD